MKSLYIIQRLNIHPYCSLFYYIVCATLIVYECSESFQLLVALKEALSLTTVYVVISYLIDWLYNVVL